MQREARAFTVALRDAHKPSLCAACLVCFRAHIWHPNVVMENLQILRTSHKDFLNAAMIFITTPRTDSSRVETCRTMAATLSQCSTPFGRESHHSLVTPILFSFRNVLYPAIGVLFELVNLCFDSDRRVVHSQRFSRRGLWPCATEDLLPFGPEQSFSSLVYWLAVQEDTFIGIGFTDIFLTCRDELSPVIMKDTNRHDFANAIAHQMQDALKLLKTNLAQDNPPGPGNFNPRNRIIKLGFVLHEILRVLSPDQVLSTRTPVPLVKDYELLLLKGIEEAITLVDDRRDLVSVATALYSSLGIPFEDHPGGVKFALIAALDGSGHAVNSIQGLISNLRREHHCGAADCTVREHDVGRRLQRCAGCGIVQYCSKDCQRRHWKAPETPHKAVCASLKRLAPFLDLAQPDFRKAVRSMNLGHDELAFIAVNVQHGDMRTLIPGPQTLAHKVQFQSTMFRMQDSLLGDEDAPPNPAAVRNAMMELGIQDCPAELELVTLDA